MIAATRDHRRAVEALLRADIGGAVFALTNLAGTGLPMRGWIVPGAAGDIVAFLGLTDDGMLLPRTDAGPEVWQGAPAALSGASLSGITGRPAAVQGLRAALGLAAAPVRHDGREDGFALALADLVVPPGPGLDLTPLGPADRPLALAWRAAYEVEALGARPADAGQRAAATVDRWLAQGSHRLLRAGARPVALTGFNADLGDLVQVGGVYVPPERRNRGLARRAVALHLAEARARGAARAILFALSPAAIAAYRSIGFGPAGEIALVLFHPPVRMPPPCPR